MRVSSVEGHIIIDSEDDIIFRTNDTERARIDENGNFSGFTGGAGGGIDNPLTEDLNGGGFNATNFADVTLTGLTGATAGARFAGGTTSGAPVAGTFAVRDFVIDGTGAIWICTVAGTPGTWAEASGTGGGGVENPLTSDLDGGGHNITDVADLTITGLTGATAGARFAGGTSSGAPVAGTFAIGDFIISRGDGKVYACTTAGSPGTWAASNTSGVPAGTSFPGSPSTNDLYYRTDLRLMFFYDGTRWLTTTLYRDTVFAPQSIATSGVNGYAPQSPNFDMYLEKITATFTVITTNDGSHYWSFEFDKAAPDFTLTSLGTFDTSADTLATWTVHTITVNQAISRTSFPMISGTSSKVSTPGSLFGQAYLVYRLIGT